MANGGQTSWTPKKQADLLREVVECGGNVSEAARTVNLSRASVYNHKASDPKFAKLLETAIQAGADVLEDECRRRAFAGTDEPVFHKGAICGHVRKYSDLLAIFLLKGAKPEKYRERIESSNRELPVGKEGILAAFSGLSHADQRALIAELRGDHGGADKPDA